MALMPGSAVFLDTNILIYASFPGAPFHDAARARLSELESDGASFWTSRQTLREYLASMPPSPRACSTVLPLIS
jgi:predicted nucleic acid-binding protein